MLVWTDLEATGLVAAVHDVLEVAVVVTDDRLREVGRFHRVIYSSIAELLVHLGAGSPRGDFEAGAAATGLDLTVVEMHARNGLWAESARSPDCLAHVDDQLAEFIERTALVTEEHDGEGERTSRVVQPQIAGSSIWFDRTLMQVGLPRSLAQLHYRQVDVTTLVELGRRFWPALHGGQPRKREIHRAMADVEDSLSLCRYYAEQVASATGEGPATTRELRGAPPSRDDFTAENRARVE